MNLLDLIKKRRSIRIFTGKKIPEEELKQILEAGVWAPSGCNNQELRFLVLEDITPILEFKPYLKGVSHFIIIFCDTSLKGSKMYKNKNQRHLKFIDTGLALQNMVIFAKSKGIDSCICNLSKYHFKLKGKIWEKILRRILIKLNLYSFSKSNFEYIVRNKLKIPKHLEITGAVALGYGKVFPDLSIAMHDGKKIKRNPVDFYRL